MNIDQIRQVIDEANRGFAAAANRKDYAGLAAFYAEDAKLLPPDAPIVSGRKGIEEFWRTAADAMGLMDVTLKSVDLEIAGDIAYEIGEADMKLTSGQAKVKYLVVWREGRDGQWRLHRDIWNNVPTS
jgi:uncharacterized protein (TIGR02246 family)